MLNHNWRERMLRKGIEVNDLLEEVVRIERVQKCRDKQQLFRDRNKRRAQASKEKTRLLENLRELEEERILEIGYNLYLRKVEEEKEKMQKENRLEKIRRLREEEKIRRKQ